MEGEFPSRRAFGVEYPGYVENPDGAVETLGGEAAILKADREGASELTLRLQRGNPVAHGVRSERTELRGGLLRLAPDGTGEIVALVDGMYRFEEMADFVYTPGGLPTNEFGKMTSLVTAQGRLFEKMVSDEPHFGPEPLMPVAPRFSKLRHPVEAVMKDRTISSQVIKGTVRDSRRFRDFNAADVPQRTTPPNHAGDVTGLERWNALEGKLSKRPIWSKWMIQQHIPESSGKELVGLLSQQCYRFRDGPWSKLWIRKGYDPRVTAEARIYQGIAYTIPQIWYFRAARSTKLSSMRALIHDATIEKMNRFASWPIEKSTILQLCDLEDEAIQSLLHDTQSRSSCCYETGWLQDETWIQIRRCVDERFAAVLEQTLRDAEQAAAEPQETEDVLASLLTSLPPHSTNSSDGSSISDGDTTEQQL